ncbi:hypothetical protein F4810DRAFT_713876 [Camillea tinctor]|nr:hypothetical protein F4810DRAFT_713876 [Camillea tinctor]
MNQLTTLDTNDWRLSILQPKMPATGKALAQQGIDPEATRLPVVVWIHGGAFSDGAATDPMWDPSRLVLRALENKTPILAVVINYRLNIFGLAASSDILASQKVVAVADADPPVVETDWRKTISIEICVGMGIYAQFLQLATGGLPLGPEVNVEHSNKTANTFAFDTLTTLAFELTQEYVQEATKAPAVQTWLREPKQKILSGNIGIDVPTWGTSFGPKGHWVSTNDKETEFNRESEFVFVFRVKRLKIRRRLKVEEYNQGAFLAVDGEQEDCEIDQRKSCHVSPSFVDIADR